MIDSIVGHPYATADAVVLGFPYEQTASFGGGAEAGPQKVIEVLDSHLEFFDRYTKSSPAYDYRFGYQLFNDIQNLAPVELVERVKSIVAAEKRFFVMLGGVHSVSIGAFQALAERHNPRDITIVQIDAHFDLRNDDSDYNDESPSQYAHSTVMRRAHELGFQILPIGIRTMSEDEYSYATAHQIQYFEWGRFDIPTPTVSQIIASIPTDTVYLTVDVDGFDPSVLPGTGTPVPGGLSWEYGEHLIREIMKQKTVIAADIMEISPIQESGVTEYAVAQLVYEILALSQMKGRV
jgi:agmatinase